MPVIWTDEPPDDNADREAGWVLVGVVWLVALAVWWRVVWR